MLHNITYLLLEVFSLKIAKVAPVYKKGSKLEYTYYRPPSLLSELHNIMEKLMHKTQGFLNYEKALYKKVSNFKETFLLCMQ